ncbi:Crp/Fnr family transcriptional regulator [Hydrogenophaga sp.]|uniref:Crp/Fnr family transcriptional regulator n=1 Tax=Hydrogenophaga sp. TaxID=1904254 RepID=UPI002728F32F|nr:cyclic nucleotide-binding domain-containing protein [Hydrogenophaga sp.]MDO9133231.1 cyclic nucleotide-binding domain-containing protein [Hydrogenophaga sp.]
MTLFDRLFGERYTAARLRKRRHQRVGVSTTARRAADLLRSTTELIQLSPAEALTVVAYMELRRCAEGEAIIRQGHSGGQDGFMALVIEGEVTVEAVTVSRTEPHTVNVLGPGHLMGEMSLMDGEARSATCIASTEVRCAVLTRTALQSLMAEEPTTAAKLLSAVAQRLSQRLRENDTKLQLYGQLVLSMQQEIEKLIPER